MNDSSICFFTCLTSGYDSINHFDETYVNGNLIHVITNSTELGDVRSTNVIFHFVENKFESNVVYNRWYKFWPFDVLPAFQYYVYFDSNILLDWTNLQSFLNNSSLSEFNSFFHPSRRNLLEEAIYNLSISKISKATFQLFRSDNFLKNYYNTPITENCVLIYSENYITRVLAIDLLNFIRLYKRDQLVLVPFLHYHKLNYTFFEAKTRNFIKKLEHSSTNSLPFGLQFLYPFYSFMKYNLLKCRLI